MPQCSYKDVLSFRMPVMTAENVKEHLLNLKRNTYSGYDNLSAFFLVKCADVLCIPLAKLFNLSIKRGICADVLKRNNIIPNHKKDDRYNGENYRGISIEPIILLNYLNVL